MAEVVNRDKIVPSTSTSTTILAAPPSPSAPAAPATPPAPSAHALLQQRALAKATELQLRGALVALEEEALKACSPDALEAELVRRGFKP